MIKAEIPSAGLGSGGKVCVYKFLEVRKELVPKGGIRTLLFIRRFSRLSQIP
jgi:hypothetical protein